MNNAPLSSSRWLQLPSSTAIAAMLLVACGKTPDPAGAPLIVVLPASAAASAGSGGTPMAIAPDDVRVPRDVGVLTLPPDPNAPSASAPLTVGVPPADPSASRPGASGIVSTSTSTPPEAQPPSVSPGTKQ